MDPVLWLALVVLAVLAMRRIGKLEKRLETLERRLTPPNVGVDAGAVAEAPVSAPLSAAGTPSLADLPGDAVGAMSGIADDGVVPPPVPRRNPRPRT